MNNKPVAWGWYDLEIKQFFPYWDEDLMENKEGCIPLYTHPVKELTDDEIDTIVRDFFGEVDSFFDFRLVIRRCISKAQEK